MALHTKKDFAVLCGITTRELSVYISRKKVLMSGDYVDDAEAINKDFIEKKQGKSGPKYEPPERPDRKLRMIKPDPGGFDDDEDNDLPPDTGDEGDSASGYALDKKKTRAQIQKLEREISLLRLREEKLTGEIIPIQAVKDLFAQHSKAGAVVVKNTIDNILTRVGQVAALNVNQIAELRGAALQEINSGINKTIEEAKKRVKALQLTHSEKREVGERNTRG